MRHVALVAAIAIIAGGCSDTGNGSTGNVNAIKKTTASPSAAPTPAIDPKGVDAVLKLYQTAMLKANATLDPELASRVEAGSALQIHRSQYRFFKKARLRFQKLRYTDGIASAPKVSGYPKWFFAAATDTAAKPPVRDMLLIVQEQSGQPWRVVYAPISRTAKGPIAPGVDVEDNPAVVPLDDAELEIAPGKIAAALANAFTLQDRSPYHRRFLGRPVDFGRRAVLDNRTAFQENGWAGSSKAVGARTPVYAVRTKSGGALVWFGIDYLHTYRNRGSGKEMTWNHSDWGDLHKGFGIPSRIRTSIERIERHEFVAYIPPKGKGKIHVIAARWFPLRVVGS